MFSQMDISLLCNECGDGEMYYNQQLTTEAWFRPEIFTLDDVDKITDSIISDFLVFVCNGCGAQVRYTLKEIEKRLRKKLSDRLFTLAAMGDLPNLSSFKSINRVLFYCGKCNGYDGKGSCPFVVYTECELKKMPML
jgi:DNA-directed RNA polymerase subunit M/transcription elongation factor TFIIS